MKRLHYFSAKAAARLLKSELSDLFLVNFPHAFKVLLWTGIIAYFRAGPARQSVNFYNIRLPGCRTSVIRIHAEIGNRAAPDGDYFFLKRRSNMHETCVMGNHLLCLPYNRSRLTQ